MKNTIRGKRSLFLSLFTILIGTSVAVRGDLTGTNAVDMLASLTGTSSANCQQVLTNLTGIDPSTLLDGLSNAEGEELLEVVASLMGLSASTGTHTVGIAEPGFRQMERNLQGRLPDFLWNGQLFPVIYYATADRTLGQVVGVDSKQDSAIWSGHYLAAEAFHYALARQKKVGAHNNGQSTVWNLEMRRVKQRIDAVVAAAHRNINISKNWKAQGTYSPAFDGEAGILFRYSFPEGAPNWLEDQGPDRIQS